VVPSGTVTSFSRGVMMWLTGHVVTGLETQVAAGDDAHHLAAITHRETGDAELLGEVDHLAHGVAGCDDGDRIAQTPDS
jgi:hypothetical protein